MPQKQGDILTSCDADGVLKYWDIRAVSELHSVNLGPYPANKLTLDPSGSVVAVASNDGSVRIVTNHGRGGVREMQAHEDACQAVAFDRTGEYLVSAGSGELFSNALEHWLCLFRSFPDLTNVSPRLHVSHFPVVCDCEMYIYTVFAG